MNDTRCCHCRFFDELNEDQGHCRRHAPRALPMAIVANNDGKRAGSVACYPIVFPHDWCGEYEPLTSDKASR